MKVPANFAERCRGANLLNRLMAEGERADLNFIDSLAAQAHRRHRIVVAGHPDPFPVQLQGCEHCPVGRGQAVRTVRIVKTVTEANDPRRVEGIHDGGQLLQRGCRIIGRQHDAAAGKTGALFKVKIRNDERCFVRPPQNTAVMKADKLTIDLNVMTHGRGSIFAQV